MSSDKSTLRKLLRQRRNAIDAAQQRRAAAELAVQLQSLPVFQQSARIAMYLANDGEIDPADAMKSCWQHIKRDKQPKQFYVPLLPNGHDPSDKTLRFAEITAQTKFANNRFGIAEPVDAPLIDARKLDLVLLPLVGFDIRGNRIGMGGGFYDATFAANRTASTAPQLVGLAHDCQCVDAITADNWDIAISAVVTDKRIYHCADLSL